MAQHSGGLADSPRSARLTAQLYWSADEMRAEGVLAWLRATPFAPFRLCLNSGRTYDIRHPEMLRVGRSIVNVYSFVGDPADPYERMEMVSLLLIERIEPLEARTQA
jgi:hypothetical protein